MKNMNKILAIVLTLAILASSLFIAVPASAGDMNWTDWKVPTLYGGGSASVYAFTGDGSAIYLYNNPTGTLGNGTGIATGAPISLVAGVNTITTTKAGTFIANLPAGLTAAVAIGTVTTVTPAALLADVATTITTTGVGTFTITVTDASTGMLYKSTDGGKTFDNANLDTNAVLSAGAVISSLKVDPADATILIATDGVKLYRSQNSGRTWTDFTSTITGTINSIDIADNNGPVYVVGTTTAMWVYDTDKNGVWTNSLIAKPGNFMSVAVGPDYSSSELIFAVNDNSVPGSYFFDTFIADGSGWNTETTTTAIPAVGGAVSNIALPSDIDTSYRAYRAFVGIGSEIWRIKGTSIVATKTVATPSEIAGVMLNGVYSLAYKGTTNSGTLVAGEKTFAAGADAFAVVNSTNMWATTAADVTWNEQAGDMPNVSGIGNAVVQFQPGVTPPALFVGTDGVDSGLFMNNTATLDSFSGVGFYHISNMASATYVARSFRFLGRANEQAVLFDNAGGVKSSRLLLTSDAGVGKTWSQVLYNPNVVFNTTAGVYTPANKTTNASIMDVSQFGDVWLANQALEYTETYFNKYYFKSVDGAKTWSKVAIASGATGNTIKVFSYIDANTYWIGGPDGLKKNTDSAWTKIGPNSEIPASFNNYITGSPAWMFVRTTLNNGFVSLDEGLTWTKVGNTGDFWDRSYSNDGPNNIIYSKPTTGGAPNNTELKSWKVPTSTSWTTEVLWADLPDAVITVAYKATGTAAAAPSFEGLQDDGFFYLMSENNTTGQAWRSQDLKAANFAPVKGTSLASAGGAMKTIRVAGKNFDGTPNDISTIDSNITLTTLPTNGYAYAQRGYTYTLTKAPAITSPAADASVNSPVDMQWSALNASDAQYELTVAYDQAMKTTVSGYNKVNQNTTLLSNIALDSGTYWIQVRGYVPAGADKSYSKWSVPQKFIVKTTGSTTNSIDTATSVYPPQGEVGISTTPVLTWGLVQGATYNIKIATDSAFTNIVDQKEGLTVALYTPAKTLDQNKTYFWEVQAVSGGIASDWVAFAFTTAVDAIPTGPAVTTAPVTPVYTFNVPTQAPITVTQIPVAPETPAYVWFIIVIGAVLVIAVIVLIVRTRRV